MGDTLGKKSLWVGLGIMLSVFIVALALSSELRDAIAEVVDGQGNETISNITASPTLTNTTYTTNTKEEVYSDGKHKLTFYSAPEFIFEDDIWKHKTQARSLKGYYILQKATDDPDYGMDIIDLNWSSATFEVEVKNLVHLNKDVPVKKKDIKLNTAFVNISTPIFANVNEKKQVVYKVADGDSVVNYNYSFGLATTTGFIIANASSDFFKDSGTTEFNDGQKNSTAGTDSQINPYGNSQNTTMLAWFNISRVIGTSSGVTITNASWVIQSLTGLVNTANVSVVEIKVFWEEGIGPGWTTGNVSFTYPNSTTCSTCPSWEGGKKDGYRGKSLANNILANKVENTNLTIDFNLAVVQEWVNNPSSNYGFQVIPDYSISGNNFVVATREHATKAWTFIAEYTINTAPTPSNLTSLPSSADTSQNIICSALANDDNADKVNATIDWMKNNVTQFKFYLNSSFSNGTSISSTLHNANTTSGDTWRCGMQLFDGLAYGAWSNSTESTVNNAVPTASNFNYTINNLLNGNQYINITFNVTDDDGIGTISSCWLSTNYGNFTATQNTNYCFANISISQNGTVQLRGNVNDTGNAIGQTSIINGVGVELQKYTQNSTRTHNFTQQFFIENFNITSGVKATLINFSRNSTDSGIIINLTNSYNQILKNEVTRDIVEDKTELAFSGSLFVAETAYSVTQTLTVNNTLGAVMENFTLDANLTVPYDSGIDVEKRIGTFTNIDYVFSNPNLKFNVTDLNSTQKDDYRFIWNGIFVTLLDDLPSTFRLSGSQKEWTYTPRYQLNLDLSAKTINHTITTLTSLPEWNIKTNWGTTLKNSTGSSITHTATDNSNQVIVGFTSNTFDTYNLTLTYYSPGGGGGGGSPGGGGGGVVKQTTIVQEANQTFVKDEQLKFSRDAQFLIPYVPSDKQETVRLDVIGKDFTPKVIISEELKPYFTIGLCDIDEQGNAKNCKSSENIQNFKLSRGDKKIIVVDAKFTKPFGDFLLANDGKIEDFIILKGEKEHKLKVVIESAPLYGLTNTLSDKTSLDEQITAGGVYAGTAGLSLYGMYLLLIPFI